jgi:hypothetical protein
VPPDHARKTSTFRSCSPSKLLSLPKRALTIFGGTSHHVLAGFHSCGQVTRAVVAATPKPTLLLVKRVSWRLLWKGHELWDPIFHHCQVFTGVRLT